MSASVEQHKIIDSVEECVTAVDDLLKESVVAVDAEGVHLGKDGPLTLLQVAKLDGFVYLFNVFAEPRLFADGRLKSVLENKDIVKVFHSCSGDSAALKCQFDVMLANVFDIQCAQYVIDRSQGRQLPNRRKLLDLCRLYTDVSSLENKDDVQTKWYKTDGAYWAKKTTEFTAEMTDYACADVRIMVPDVYEKIKRILDEKNLWKEFEENVDYELQSRWNSNLPKNKNQETTQVKRRILEQFDTKYTSNTKLADVTDEDDLQALRQLRIQDVGEFSETVQKLRKEILQQEIDKIERDLETKGDAFVLVGSHFRVLDTGRKSKDDQVKERSQRLNDKLDDIFKRDLVTMYNETTPVRFLSEDEKRNLRRLQSSTKDSPDPILRHLYNITIADDEAKIDTLMTKFKQEGRQFELPVTEHKLYKYYISDPKIPVSLKNKAKTFLRELEKAKNIPNPNPRKGSQKK